MTERGRRPAHVIRDSAEAEEVAGKLAAEFAARAGERDRDRELPAAEVERLSATGLLAISVPARFGGADVPVTTLAEVFRVLATADASLAQIPHSHFVFLDALRRQGTEQQQERFFTAALAGARFANAQSEKGGRTVADDATSLRRDGTRHLLDGDKFYCTGALFAHYLVVRAVLEDGSKALAYISRDTPGVTVEDDWDGIGQRTTASGTVHLRGVPVDTAEIVPFTSIFDRPTTYGARAQVLHAALDAGIARGALDAAVAAVGKARPWFESGAASAAAEPLVIQQAGELEITVRAAEALLREAAGTIDAADAEPTDDSTARASIATAVAKVAAARAAVEVAGALFELGGTRSASAALGLDRHWRDARTHTLHDPTRWKVQHIGRWLLSGTRPPRHGQL
ncbi:SfnB family sulfur acquisition oxidoreductase [Frankia sp. CcI49]|uniref:SfnB family sulfur acquisition oxidoreductase n=1 Tax=unclassified Frankia TaxID=2632575 RepID=UPI0006CA565C|nr:MULTISPECIES: SfnB family sulfur acquisition oxidoreductase [unclassified Frankia]KPM52108.1 monooxygenase [Frankia sp. R43]ONH49973.1 SfnB family sulfur acquisition oxidoreductase [Frankia sp. CcI49]